MNLFSPIILQLALRSLLVKKLQKSILLLQKSWKQNEESSPTSGALSDDCLIASQEIPIKLIKGEIRPSYVSAIAFKVSNHFGLPVIELAHEIETELSRLIRELNDSDNHLPLDRVYTSFVVHTASPGWVHFRLSDAGIGLWSQLLVKQGRLEGDRSSSNGYINSTVDQSYENDNQNLSNFTSPFIIQYTHARCCSLLRLAQQEGLIQLAHPLGGSGQIAPRIIAPDPLPWLDRNHNFCLRHSTEQHLMAQLILTLDQLADSTLTINSIANRSSLKRAQELSHAFQAFYRTCQIFGEAKTTCVELTQARLGLVSMTQIVLEVLLQKCIGVIAPLFL